jgi:hypothetical protein
MNVFREQSVSIVWPIIFITVGLFVYVISQYLLMERATIMNNWSEMRCNVLIMFAAYWLKPDDDLRSSGEFAASNFQFCTKDIIQSVMKVVMSPLSAVFAIQAEVTKVFTKVLESIKAIITKMINDFLAFLQPVFIRFNAIVYQIGIVMQKLRSAFDRANAALLAAVFSGIAVVKGIQNAIKFVIFIVLIICGIMLAIIIILFFILFPFIPVIITPALVLIITVGVILGVEAEAQSKKAGFCFTGDTPVPLADGSTKPISELVLGEGLANGATVESILQMEGLSTPLYELEGIRVSGTHLVQQGSTWHSVSEDSRAKPIQERSERLYCLNTSDQIIPVLTRQGTTVLFRDWEEIDSRDTVGQHGWNKLISSLLGGLQVDAQADDMSCLLDPTIPVPTPQGPKPLHSIQIGDEVELSYNRPTRVIGVVKGRVQGLSKGPHWLSGVIEKIYRPTDGPIHRRLTTLLPTTDSSTSYLHGNHVITESGELVAYINGTVRKLRDFTEVGVDQIHRTYPFVSQRLASFLV